MRRNRRRYGGYAVHLGVVVLLVGVAASSAFKTERDVRLRPGQTAEIGGYDVRYVRPTSGLSNEKLEFGAVLDVRKDGKRVTLLRPSRSYFASQDASMGHVRSLLPRVSRPARSASRRAATRDIWTAVQPDLRLLNAPLAGKPTAASPTPPATFRRC